MENELDILETQTIPRLNVENFVERIAFASVGPWIISKQISIHFCPKICQD